MVRAAAKNHAHVGVVVDPADYGAVLDELRERGQLATRRGAGWPAPPSPTPRPTTPPSSAGSTATRCSPPTLHLALERAQELRYGENPHQQGARYRHIGGAACWDDVDAARRHGAVVPQPLRRRRGVAAGARRWATGRSPPSSSTPTPAASASPTRWPQAYQLAYECDAKSRLRRHRRPQPGRSTHATAEEMVAAAQADVVIAPGYEDGVIEALAKKRRNTRVLTAPPPSHRRAALPPDRRRLPRAGGAPLRRRPRRLAGGHQARAHRGQWPDAELAWRICGHVKSNAIVLVAGGQAVGIGAGQQNRVESGRSPREGRRAGPRAGRARPTPSIPSATASTPRPPPASPWSIQPGGGMRDDEIIAAADEHGMAMVFTGERHFLH